MSGTEPFTTGLPDELPPALGVGSHVGCVSGRPGTVQVNVRNEAAQTRILAVAMIGLDPDWLPEPVRTAPVAPGETVTVSFLVSPPRGTLAADYGFAVSAQALDPATGQATSSRPGLAEVVLTVSPRAQVRAKVVPGEFSTVWRKRFAIHLRNDGDRPTTVRLSSTQPNGMHVALPGRAVQVPARSSRRVNGSARMRRPRLFGWVGQHRFSVSVLGDDAQTHAEAVVLQRPVLPPFLAKAIAILTTLALWLAMAMVFLPEFGQWVRSTTDSAERSATQELTDRGSDATPGAPTEGDSPTGDSPAGGGGSGAAGGTGGSGGGTASPASTSSGVQFTGTVAGDDPGRVTVRLEPTSLVDEEAQGGVGVGVDETALASSGLRLASAFTKVSSRTAQPVRTASTTADGSYAFAGVRAPGYYLLTFTKPGFQTRKYVIDSSSPAAVQPLEVPLTPGEGSLSGTVRGPRGGVGGVDITISDGTNTVTTSSASKGAVGTWRIDGLSTPSAYVVQASTHDMSTEARLVNLSAGASATADLTLAAGVATLTGQVTHEGDTGKESGLGGATVTVSDGAGNARTATTLTQGRVGWYTIPGLSAPGSYSVRITADGYQRRATQLVLRRGQTRAERSTMLTSSAAVLSGRVSGPNAGLVGAGLVLSNAENVYKTTSTSSPQAGAYRFNRVTPGTYTLTTTMFGLATDRVTVTLTSGRTTVINRTLTTQPGGVIPNASVILGEVKDFSTGQQLRACSSRNPYTPQCVRAQVTDTDPTTDKVTTYTDDFEPTEQYRLPATGTAGGLRPGLHTVQVSAPGYMIGTVDVQVASNQTVQVPTLHLQPAPSVTGVVGTVAGTPPPQRSCVWVVKDITATTPTVQQCRDAIAAGADPTSTADPADTCYPGTATWEAVDFSQNRFCAATDASGAYTVEVPDAGEYALVVTPLDSEYLSTRTTRSLAIASTTDWDPTIDRLGRVTVKLLAPDTANGSNALVPVPGRTVSVSPAPTFAPSATNSQGVVVLKGLRAGAYTITATSADGRQSGSTSWTAALNDSDQLTHRMVLDRATLSLVGQVTSRPMGVDQPVSGATVKLRVATSYPGEATAPTTSEVTLTSDPSGCFEVRDNAMPRTTATCGTVAGSAAAQTPLASSRVESGTITKAGYETYQVPANTLFSSDVENLRLIPQRIDQTAVVAATHAPADWAEARVQVTVEKGASGPVSASLSGSAVSSRLVWAEQGAPAGTVRPGRYRVSVSLPGYAGTERTLECTVQGTCTWLATDLILPKLGTVTVEVTSTDGTPVTGAEVTLHDTTETAGDSENRITFPEVTPDTDLEVHVRAAGYRFGAGTFTCPGPGTSHQVAPGGAITCTVAIEPLATVTGEVRAVIHPETSGSATTEALSGATVVATLCLDTDCDVLSTEPTDKFLVTSSADVADQGGFTITGSRTQEGLLPGTWALIATKPGYRWAGSHPWGEKVTIEEGPPVVSPPAVTLTLRQIPRAVTVTLTANNQRVAGATVTRTSVTEIGESEAAVEVPGMVGVYRFAEVEPGFWSFRASATGMRDLPSPTINVTAGDTDFDVPLEMTPAAGTVSGVVLDDTGTPVRSAQVMVLCRPDTGNSGACPTSTARQVALGTDAAALTTSTAADGSFTLDSVRPGTYDVEVSRRGHLTQTATFEFTATSSHPFSPVLERVRTSILWNLSTTSGAPLGSSTAKLTPTDGPSGVRPVPIGQTTTDLLWGCYTMTLTLPDEVDAMVDAPQITLNDVSHSPVPDDPELTCAPGQLEVPTSGDLSAGIVITQSVHTQQLDVNLAWATTAHTQPPINLRVTGAGLTGPALDLTREHVANSTTLWVRPDTYQVRATPDANTAFWPEATTQQDVDLRSSDGTVSLTLREETVQVTVRFSDPSAVGAGSVQISPGAGQTAAPPAPAFLAAGQDSIILNLPSGRWVVEGSWAEGPGATSLNLTSTDARVVTFAASGTTVTP